MQFTLKALFDDQTRKEIREAVLGEARAMARNLIEVAFADEMRRILGKLQERFAQHCIQNDWLIRNVVKDVVRDLLSSRSDELVAKLDQAVEERVDKEVKKKLKDKTVWEASTQKAEIQGYVRTELKKLITIKDD